VEQNGCDFSALRALLHRVAPASLIVIALLSAGVTAHGENPLSEAPASGAQVTAQPTEPWVQTELFFGLAERHGRLVSTRAWQRFEATVLAPAFPDGFTLVKAEGHWADRNHTPHKEPAEVLIVIYRSSDAASMSSRIEQVSKAYTRQFDQESVLRADSKEQVRFYKP
jgi:Protein of unknown function (DUF3574)